MATFMAHGLLEAGVVAAATQNPYWTGAAFLHGITPDVIKWIEKKSHPEEGLWYWIYWPHFALDKIFHRYEAWWPYYWWLEILMWLVGIGGLLWGLR